MPLHEAKIDLHREFREREKLRIDATPKLSEKFRQVKTLKIELDYFEGDSTRRLSLVTYTLNLDHARAAFTFPCPNDSCLEGDFDLSLRLTEAVQNQQANIKGEMRCPGRRCSRKTPEIPCNCMLRYELKLSYQPRGR